jgi:hypothetical protein
MNLLNAHPSITLTTLFCLHVSKPTFYKKIKSTWLVIANVLPTQQKKFNNNKKKF